MSPAHKTYDGPLKVRVLPQGVCGEDLDGAAPLGMSKATDLKGYETTVAACRRLKLHMTTLHRLCRQGLLDHIRVGKGASTRVYIARGAVPKEKA